MKFLRQIMVGFVMLLALANMAHAQGGFPLKNGDCVVFYGDSITEQRLYTTFIETYVVTRFPGLNVYFVHSGWSGDRVSGDRGGPIDVEAYGVLRFPRLNVRIIHSRWTASGRDRVTFGHGGPIDVRLQRDVIAYQPTVITIMLGMNDGEYRPFNQEVYNKYTNGYENIIKTIKDALPGIRITVIKPSPFDEVTRPAGIPGGYNSVLLRFGQFLQELGRRESLTVADMNSPMLAVLEKAKTIDPQTAQQIIPDRVHPGPGGHLIMAEALLKAWNAPAQVSSVEIDVPGKHVVRAENTAVTGLNVVGRLTWTQMDKALPLPLDWKDKALALAVKCSDVVEALDEQPLKLTGLKAGRYALKIDNEDVGVFTQKQLEAGLNLAPLPTPMAKQAQCVHALTLRHNQIHFVRWREFQVPIENQQFPQLQRALDTLDKLEAEIIAEQRATAQPKLRNYALIPQ